MSLPLCFMVRSLCKRLATFITVFSFTSTFSQPCPYRAVSTCTSYEVGKSSVFEQVEMSGLLGVTEFLLLSNLYIYMERGM